MYQLLLPYTTNIRAPEKEMYVNRRNRITGMQLQEDLETIQGNREQEEFASEKISAGFN